MAIWLDSAYSKLGEETKRLDAFHLTSAHGLRLNLAVSYLLPIVHDAL